MKNHRRLAIVGAMLALSAIATKAQDGTTLEAEDAKYEQCKLIEDAGYSGGKALEMTEQAARITFTFHAEEKGKYTVSVGYDGLYGEKQVSVAVNGSSGSFATVTKGRDEATVGTYFMDQGDNTIEITPSWTWYRIDYIRIAGSSGSLAFDIPASTVDAQATEPARKMYAFLYDNFGKKTISGIMTGDMASANGDVTRHDDVKAVWQASGKYPALVGFDFLNATGKEEATDWSRDYTLSALSLAKDLYRRGGLPAFTWHWRDPSRATGEFYSSKCSVKISDALNDDGTWNTSSALYASLIKDIDTVADYFLQLQADGVACIFRPLHEAGGGWFWWGADGGANCARLYRLVFDEMVKVKGVHNLIWVWNPAEKFDDWNPGEEYFDVVAIDIYNEAYDYSSNYVMFDKLKALTGGRKIIALSENGPIPDIDRQADEEAMWSWWMPWYQTWDGKYVDKTSREEWTKCMGDPRVITLDDLSAGWDAYTAIRQMPADRSASQAVYDLQGRRLATAPASGLYIKGGKAFLAH